MNENLNLCNILKEKGIHLFLFGSALNKDFPRDLDILMVYSSTNVSIQTVIDLKNQLLQYFKKKCHIPIDLLLLSLEEVEEIDFIEKESAYKLNL